MIRDRTPQRCGPKSPVSPFCRGFCLEIDKRAKEGEGILALSVDRRCVEKLYDMERREQEKKDGERLGRMKQRQAIMTTAACPENGSCEFVGAGPPWQMCLCFDTQ